MAQYDILKSFYNSTRWRKFRESIIAERGPVCVDCHKIIANSKEIELDHDPIELTPENVNDVMISLNPDNVKVRCHDCHNKRHGRFCSQKMQGVFLIYGPPLSGKTTYVLEHMQHGDLVIDMDKLYSAVSFLPEYDKPNGLLPNVLGVRDLLIDNVKTRYGKWSSAWIIGGYEDKYKREKVADDTGATIILCEASREECLARLEADESRRCRKDEWTRYIDRWFDRFVA
ncbi:MAG TPA: HNH endonuclease [Caproiciproducens sp.]|nr:HNH endonuclease [Caproiciproducens sp.]